MPWLHPGIPQDGPPARGAAPTAFRRTDHALSELQLYSYRPDGNTPDPRLVLEDDVIEGAVSDIFDALIATMADTGLDTELNDLLWSTGNMFHRATERIERKLDATSRRKSAASANRTAPKSRPSNSSVLSRSAKASSNAATAWKSSATVPPNTICALLERPGRRARDHTPTTVRSPRP